MNNQEDAEDVAQESFHKGFPSPQQLSRKVAALCLTDAHCHE
jgi:DNA-directed RNA polymerase specialized sigma24 family protein